MVLIAGIEIPSIRVSRLCSASPVGLGVSSFIQGNSGFIDVARELIEAHCGTAPNLDLVGPIVRANGC